MTFKKELITLIIVFTFLGGCISHNFNNGDFIRSHEHYYGKVTKVVDGDTVYVNVNGEMWKIRLLGVDTPETYGKNSPYEYFLLNGTPITNTTYLKIWGEKAKYFAKKELENKTVIIVFDNRAPKKDRYGRYLAYIFINDSNNLINFNEELLKYGYARVYISNFELKNEFLEAEKEAKKNKIGLWNWKNN
ncbi:calcium-activated nuclease EcnA [Methanocaldococcus fervens]|uniref:Nuclease (SNase domain protein) n=1 Tax=Methanocaldococcus fervens (strain DSM 4213 / JCM 15782 / AG86) TaxID=573064 RepID=C7P642_METFA|nr:thermonuclease family protein [Methanocaldococcus fervens]ACV24024.1 nuclease (SNase domain protein) [Methanocaldococcus fervens AG86]